MPTPLPKLLTNELIHRLSQFRFGDVPSEFEIKLFLREAEKLKQADPAQGWMVSGIIDSLLYNYKDTKKAFEKALRNGPSEFDVVVSNYALALRRLGRLEEAIELLDKYASEDSSLLLNNAFSLSLNAGLFNKAKIYSEKLKKLSINEDLNTEYLNDLTVACNELNISESDCSEVHLLVLNIIYGKKISAVEFVVRRNHENYNSLILLFYIDASVNTLADIGLEIIDKLVEIDIAAIVEQKVTPLVMKGFNRQCP